MIISSEVYKKSPEVSLNSRLSDFFILTIFCRLKATPQNTLYSFPTVYVLVKRVI